MAETEVPKSAVEKSGEVVDLKTFRGSVEAGLRKFVLKEGDAVNLESKDFWDKNSADIVKALIQEEELRTVFQSYIEKAEQADALAGYIRLCMADAKRKSESKVHLLTTAELQKMSTGELMMQLLTEVKTFGDEMVKIPDILKAYAAKHGHAFTAEEISKMKLDANAFDNNVFKRHESFRLAAKMLNLDLTGKKFNNNAEFLKAVSMTEGTVNLGSNKDNLKDAVAGDLIFFQWADKPGVEMVAVVVENNPLKVKVVPAGEEGGNPKTEEFSKLPEAQNEIVLVKMPKPKSVSDGAKIDTASTTAKIDVATSDGVFVTPEGVAG